MALEEQTEIFANRIRRLKQYQFLLRPAESEGTISTNVFPINISTVTRDPETDKLHFPDRELMGELRGILAATSGKPIKELLQQQDASFGRYTHVVEGQMRRQAATIRRAHHTNGAAAHRTDSTHPVSAAATAGSHQSADTPPEQSQHRVIPAAVPADRQGRPVKRRIRLS